MKMAGLLWLSASVLLLQSCSCIDEEQLSPVVDEIWKNYKVNNMFSIAASIPKKENQEDEYDVSQVLNAEKPEAVKTAMKKKEVYMHGRIVAATVTKNPDVKGDFIHAEYRVLQNFDNLLNQKFDYDNDLMLFYVLAAPCVQKCTDENNPENILKYLPKLKRWKHYAFAFSGLYLSRNPQKSLSDEQRKAGVQKVAGSLGLENVFRCVESDGQMQCRSCADQNNQVTDFCYSDTPSSQSDDENCVTPTVPNALESAPDVTGAANRMTDEAESQGGGGATEENQGNEGLEPFLPQTLPGNVVTEGEQAGREGGGRVGRKGGKGKVGGKRDKGKVGRKGGRGKAGRRGKGKVGRKGGRGKVRRRGKGKVGRKGGRGKVRRRGKGKVGRKGGRGKVRRRGKGKVGRKGGRGKVRRRGGRRTGRKRGVRKMGRRGGRRKTGRKGGRRKSGRKRRGGKRRLG